MNVNAKTTIYDLVGAYPYLLDWLADYDPHFDNLRNPALFNTMARFATLEHAAEMAGKPVEPFLDAVRSEIARREIVAEETGGAAAPGTPIDAETEAARQAALKAIILKLHDGVPADQVKAEFDELVRGVDSAEIARMEQALIAEGMPVDDVQRLCDVHVSVFKESLDAKPDAEVAPGHPLDAYKRENVVAGQIVGELRAALTVLSAAGCADGRSDTLDALASQLERLAQVDVHYTRKEHQLFPALEAHDVSGPTKVMWGLDDDIRGRIKSERALVAAGDCASLAATLPETLTMIDDMVYKEEKILFPTALQLVSDAEWAQMAAGDAEIGYAWVEERLGPDGSPAQRSALQPASAGRSPAESPATHPAPAETVPGQMLLPLPTGSLTLAQLDLLFRILPFDLTYVDENDRVRFFSEGERVFPRSPGAIGREVRNCHPPKSLAKVEAILAEFKAGTKDVAEFWIEMAPKFIHIRYYALRDEAGAYKGCLEVVQEVSHIRALEGERRIVDW